MEKNNIQNSIKNDKKKIIIFISVLIILVVALIIFIFLNKEQIQKEGNTIGNIRNLGYAAEDENYIYFMTPDDKGELKTICRINKNLEQEVEQLIEGDWDITGINVYKDYLYFITIAESTNSNDLTDNRIHKMKIDGSEHQVINNNEFHNSCYEIYVIKDKLYYIGEDEGIYTMNLDGTYKNKINGTASGFIGITNEYIFYNVIEGESEEEQKIVTHMMNLDGSNDKEITGEKLYSINVVEDKIYYTDVEGRIFKVKIGETKTTMLSNVSSYCLNVTSDGIYYLKYIDKEQQAIFKMDLNGNNVKKIKTLETSSSFLSVMDDWIVYLDSTDTDGIIAMVSKDGKKYQELYSLNFKEYLSDIK